MTTYAYTPKHNNALYTPDDKFNRWWSNKIVGAFREKFKSKVHPHLVDCGDGQYLKFNSELFVEEFPEFVSGGSEQKPFVDQSNMAMLHLRVFIAEMGRIDVLQDNQESIKENFEYLALICEKLVDALTVQKEINEQMQGYLTVVRNAQNTVRQRLGQLIDWANDHTKPIPSKLGWVANPPVYLELPTFAPLTPLREIKDYEGDEAFV